MLLKPARVVIAVVSLISGCTVGPNYTHPAVSLPDEYQENPILSQRQAMLSADVVDWWKGFGDPLLTGYVTRALNQNLDLAQASARVMQARAGLGMAHAALLPIASASGQASRVYQSEQTPTGQISSNLGGQRYGNVYEANIGASWELDLFGGLQRDKESAFADYQASEAAVIATQLAVTAQVADTYILIRGLQAREGIARQQISVQAELLSMMSQLYAKGLVAETQVREHEANLSQLRAVVPALQAGIDIASNALDVSLGDTPGTHRAELAVATQIPVPPMISQMGSPRELLRRRPDLMVAERRLAAANARIGSAMAEYYPKFSLSALLGSSTTVGSNLFSAGAGQAAGVLGFRWRLFDFNRIHSQIELAKGQEAERLAAYRLAVLRATGDVENAFSNLINAELQYNELETSVQALTRTHSVKSVSYQKGVSSKMEVLQADQKLLNTADLRSQVQTSFARAAVSVFSALGGGWQHEN